MPLVKRQEIRCFCARQPLLGILTEDSRGIFFHVKIYKANRVMGEVKFRSGLMEIACRECLRWHRLFLDKGLKVEPEENRSTGVA